MGVEILGEGYRLSVLFRSWGSCRLDMGRLCFGHALFCRRSCSIRNSVLGFPSMLCSKEDFLGTWHLSRWISSGIKLNLLKSDF